MFGHVEIIFVQVNLCQKLLFLHQLTHNMTTDCSLNYKFNTWNFQAQAWGEQVGYRNCFRYSEQFLYTTCSPHVLQKEELLTKICLYRTESHETVCHGDSISDKGELSLYNLLLGLFFYFLTYFLVSKSQNDHIKEWEPFF